MPMKVPRKTDIQELVCVWVEVCACTPAVTTVRAGGTQRASLIVSSIILCVCWSISLLVQGARLNSQFSLPGEDSDL